MILQTYVGKRFAGFLACVSVLGSGYFIGPADKFTILATTLGTLYAAFVAGQSYTDAKEVK